MVTHEDRKDFKCGVCGIENKNLEDLKIHLKTHEPEDAKYAHCCELCGKRYKNGRLYANEIGDHFIYSQLTPRP